MRKSGGNNNRHDSWLALNEKYRLLDQIKEHGIARLTADQIREVHEPRLLTKIEEEARLPEFLKVNKLSILPLSKYEFAIGNFLAFETLPESKSKNTISLPKSDLISLHLRPNSESSAILTAMHAGIFEKFLNESPVQLGILGKQSSGRFTFKIGGYPHPLTVDGSQIEVDAGFETPKSIALIEAKATEVKSFLIRQLYYPYRTWTNKLDGKKIVRPIFLTVSNDKFSLVEYRFRDVDNYSSIEYVRSETYVLEDGRMSETLIQSYLRDELIPIPKEINYPQADKIDRIVSLLIFIHGSDFQITKSDVAAQQVFVGRQADYYLDAARYLGFLETIEDSDRFDLTSAGEDLVDSTIAERNKLLTHRLLQDPIVRQVYLEYRAFDLSPKKLREMAASAIQQKIESREIAVELGTSTIDRRAQTITAWVRWIIEHVDA